MVDRPGNAPAIIFIDDWLCGADLSISVGDGFVYCRRWGFLITYICRRRELTGTESEFLFFGHTDLWISLSRAKFDEEADFEVRFAVARHNQRQISEKRKIRPETFADKNFSASKKETLSETRLSKVSCRSEPCPRSYDKSTYILTYVRTYKIVTSIHRNESFPQRHMAVSILYPRTEFR